WPPGAARGHKRVARSDEGCYYSATRGALEWGESESSRRGRMYDETRELVDALRVTPETLAGLLRDVTPERARAARGGDEDWSVVEVMCHMRDTEEQALGRMRALRDMPDPVVGGFDQMALARERSYATDDLHAALAAFA